MLLLVHVHVRSRFGMIDTIGRIVEKRIDWKQPFNYCSDPFATKKYRIQFIVSSLIRAPVSFAQQLFLCLFRLVILERPNIKW